MAAGAIVRGHRRRLLVVSALQCLTACGGHLSPIADPNPRDYANRAPVVVLEGQCSYYSDSLAGNETANGEIYDPSRLTAASRDLPFGSIVRVTRRDTGASVLVRVNDRGPFGSKERILDLSRAAAEQLRMLQRGVAPIRAEVLVLGKSRRRR